MAVIRLGVLEHKVRTMLVTTYY